MTELCLRLVGEAMGQQFSPEFDVETSVSVRVGAGEALLGPAADLCIDLAESVFLVVALDAFGRHLHHGAAGNDSSGLWGERLKQCFGLSIVGTAVKRRV